MFDLLSVIGYFVFGSVKKKRVSCATSDTVSLLDLKSTKINERTK